MGATRDAEHISQHPQKVRPAVHEIRDIAEQRYSCEPRTDGLGLFENLPDTKAFVLDASRDMWARRQFLAFN